MLAAKIPAWTGVNYPIALASIEAAAATARRSKERLGGPPRGGLAGEGVARAAGIPDRASEFNGCRATSR